MSLQFGIWTELFLTHIDLTFTKSRLLTKNCEISKSPLFLFFRRTVRYCLTNNKHFSFPADALPEKLQSQKHIVDLMANYMEQNLMEVSPEISPEIHNLNVWL